MSRPDSRETLRAGELAGDSLPEGYHSGFRRARSSVGTAWQVLDAVGSIPFGVAALTLVLLWCWIGSAGTAPFGRWLVRQSFEKTEMEWFSWWPFHVLLGALAISIVLATVRRVRLTWPNLGVWTAHLGVIVLLAGCAVYFGRKIEGDVVVYRRAAALSVEGGPEARLVLQPGASARVSGPDGGEYAVSVLALDPAYRLLTGDDAGRTTYAAQLMVTPPPGRAGSGPFVRQLLDGYPQYTEDVLPGRGRAVKVLGRPLVDERFRAALEYAAADRVHLQDRPALLARVAGQEDWTQFPLPGLPRYHERLADPGDASFSPGLPVPRGRPLRLKPRALDPRTVPDEVRFLVTGFLPAAWLEETREPGGDEFAPILRVALERDGLRSEATLLAGHPERAQFTRADGLTATFAWSAEAAAVAASELARPASLLARVPSRGLEQRFLVSDLLERPRPLAGTPYTLSGERYVPRWVMSGGDEASLLLVRIEGGGRGFLRAVLHPRAEDSRDFDAEGELLPELVDASLELALENVRAPGLAITAGPHGLHGWYTDEKGRSSSGALAVGTAVAFDDGKLQVTVEEYAERSRAVERPVVIPPEERDARAGSGLSLIRVEAARGAERRELWLRYSPYAHPNRIGFHPRTVSFDHLPPIELLFSRRLLRLAAPVALESFELETFPGGTREREYRSRVRFHAGGRWSEARAIETNRPTEEAGWWFFQSTWDPPEPESGYAGLNYTGLGVGNRHGVGVMLLGGCLITAGTIWAFYVKPVLLRRRRARAPASPTGIVAALLGLAALAGAARGAPAPTPLPISPAFAAGLDLSRIRLAAVQEDGRVKAFDSLAREKLRLVNARLARSADPVLWYLDLVLAPERYAERAIVRIHKPAFRRQLAHAIRSMVPPEERTGAVAASELMRLERDGLVSPEFLGHPAVRHAASALERDLLRTGKEVQKLHTAWALTDGRFLASLWRTLPPPGDPSGRWISVEEVLEGGGRGDALDPAVAASVARAWNRLAEAWRAQDAGEASAALDALAASFREASPAAYPSMRRMAWEHWYYKHDKLTRAWLLYFLALPFLLMGTVLGLGWARRVGFALFAAGFAAHSFSIGLRWWLAGRIPNANMFEAVLASAWFGGLFAVVLEILLRRRPVRGLPALAASTYAMLAMMAGHFVPVLLPSVFSSDIGTVMPVLDRTVWLYIHTNIVIASYALIFFGSVTALLYLVLRAAARLAPGTRLAALWAGAAGEGPARGEAAGLLLGRGRPPGDAGTAGLARSLDGATMIFLELAFIALFAGTVLGAIWADASWGRPWGWDPKEVFALNTWLVFLILVHVRLRVRDKGLWTAWLALAGCAVMLFNWIAVNFLIVGLHSYA